MNRRDAHLATIGQDFLTGAYYADCSCGWKARDVGDRDGALVAIGEHVGTSPVEPEPTTDPGWTEPTLFEEPEP